MGGPSNGASNGAGNVGDFQQQKDRSWTIGLINSKLKYLTAETFGFKINANGASMRKKQMWTLLPSSSVQSASCSTAAVVLRSHLGRYLTVDGYGNVTCEAEQPEPGASDFHVSVAEDGSGRWALRNADRQYFLGASADKLVCSAKTPADAELWYLHLAARPQVNLYNLGRKRFAHLSPDSQEELCVDSNVPWGEDSLFTLEFRDTHYALHTCTSMYLHRDGCLQKQCTDDCLFSIEYHNGSLALRDHTGLYLAPVGSKAVLRTRSRTVTRDELFTLENSLPQCTLTSALNDKYVSVKQGVDVTANQDEVGEHERFLMEFDLPTSRWYLRTMTDQYWTLDNAGAGIQAANTKKSGSALFEFVWHSDGSVSLLAANGRCLAAKKSGHLFANAEADELPARFFFHLVNRPMLVLKCDQGFVGYRTGSSSMKIECNKAHYDVIHVEQTDRGQVYFRGENDKYWVSENDGVCCSSTSPSAFYIELRDSTHMCIKSASGSYLCAQNNGSFRLCDTEFDSATYWEF